jgi:hypothetical protein
MDYNESETVFDVSLFGWPDHGISWFFIGWWKKTVKI